MRKYETMMVLHPELPEAQIRETLDRAKLLVEGLGGEVEQVHEWGMRELAYPISKLKRGYYIIMDFCGEPAVVDELGRTLKLADEVLRHATVLTTRVRGRAAVTPRAATSAMVEQAVDENAVAAGQAEASEERKGLES